MVDFKTILISLFIFFVFFIIASIYKNYYKKKQDNLIKYGLSDIIYYLLLFIGLFFSLIQLGIQTTSLYTIFGSIGLTLALSLQSTLSILASGLYISLNNLYNIGETIEILGPNGTIYNGKVSLFNLFNTTILSTKDNTPIIIPNNYIQNNILNKKI
jgi:small conductance mechanosensitive channel